MLILIGWKDLKVDKKEDVQFRGLIVALYLILDWPWPKHRDPSSSKTTSFSIQKMGKKRKRTQSQPKISQDYPASDKWWREKAVTSKNQLPENLQKCRFFSPPSFTSLPHSLIFEICDLKFLSTLFRLVVSTRLILSFLRWNLTRRTILVFSHSGGNGCQNSWEM